MTTAFTILLCSVIVFLLVVIFAQLDAIYGWKRRFRFIPLVGGSLVLVCLIAMIICIAYLFAGGLMIFVQEAI